MSIMDFFRGGSNQQTAMAPGGQNSTGPAQPGTTAGNNPSVPSDNTPKSDGSVAAIPTAGQGASSPDDRYKDLWKADPKQPTEQVSLVPALNLDPAKMLEAAKTVNLVSHITDDRLQKAMSDPAELRNLLNEVAQVGLANSAVMSGKIIENSLGSAQNALQDKLLPHAFRQQAVDAALASNPVFQEASVAPFLDMTKQQLMAKYPTAPANEIARMAAEVLSGVANKVVVGTGRQIVDQNQGSTNNRFGRQQEPDWEKYFGGSFV